jgi:membrane fusion protein (multidrug efflux system)
MSFDPKDSDFADVALMERRPRPSAAAVSSEETGHETAPRSDDVIAPEKARRERPANEQPAHEQPHIDSPPLDDDGHPEPDEAPKHFARRRGLLRLRPFASGLAVLVLISVGAAGYLYWDNAKHFESTDDSFIAARQFAIQAKVSGYLTAVTITDNQHVVAGEVIAKIDQRDYRVALEQAHAQVENAQANIQNIDAQISEQDAQINAAQAAVDQAQAALIFAQQQAERYAQLAKTGAGTVQSAQQYSSQLRQQQATLAAAQATLKLQQRHTGSLKAQRDSAAANLAQAQAQLDQAALNLSYTAITAAEPGRVVNLSAAVGQFAQAGTALTNFVPDEIWVTANFKETQLDSMRPGQPVTLTIDAYPERAIRGHVASIQSGSGPAFSLLPPENATGNWVKIVQRVPVKIVLDNPPTDVALGPGMSVETSVRINPHPSLYEKLRSSL